MQSRKHNPEVRRTPRVLLVIGGLDCGGAQRALADMANYWQRLGWAVTLATWSGPEVQDFYELDERVGRVRLSAAVATSQASRLQALRRVFVRMVRFRRLVAATAPDAVLSFIDVSNVLTILSTRGLGVRVVVSERTNPGQNNTISRLWKSLRWATYRWAEVVVAQTGDAARWLQVRCGVSAVVIPNCIRRMPDLDISRAPLIVAVGRLTHEKGIDTLLRAFALLSGQFPDWRLAIAGDGPERASLVRLREELDLVKRVDFLGEIREVETLLASAGMFVHASRREGFPNAILEAMAMGAPVIGTDCPSGPSDIIRDRVNGRLIVVDDVGGLVEAMAEFINNPELRSRMTSEALRVRHAYAQDLIMDRWNAALFGPARGLKR